MTIFTLSNLAGRGFNMAASTAAGFSFIGTSKLKIGEYVDDGHIILAEASGVPGISYVGLAYQFDGDYLFIQDAAYFNANGTPVLTIDSWNLELSVSTLAAGGYIGFEVNTLNDKFYGNKYADLIHGGPGRDVIMGGGGNDTLYGDAGIDGLRGGNGNDYLIGGAATDVLIGDLGSDTLNGGTSGDAFVYLKASDSGALAGQSDVIRGFQAGLDEIDFTTIGGLTYGGSGVGTVHAVQNGTNTVVLVNLTADPGYEMKVVLANFTASTLTDGDFVL